MIRLCALLFCVGSMSGCASLQTSGAEVADAALQSARWVTCTATTVGALERDLAGDPVRIAGWLMYCGKRMPHPMALQVQRGLGVVSEQ